MTNADLFSKARLTDLDIVNAKNEASYPIGTPLWYGVNDYERRIADAATAKALKVLAEEEKP